MDENFEWRGAGFDPRDGEMRLPFHRLLSAMGEEFARDLKASIASRGFYTWFIAPMIGGGGILELNGMESYRKGRQWGDALMALSELRGAEFSDGYYWLVSLHKGSTAKANQTTIGWIDRWLWPLTP